MLSNNNMDKLPNVGKVRPQMQNMLTTIPEDRYRRAGSVLSFISGGNKTSIAKPPKKKTSLEMLSEQIAKGNTNLPVTNIASIKNQSSTKSNFSLQGVIDFSLKGNKPLKAAQVKNATCVNENGLLNVILNKIDREKQIKIKKALERLNTNQK